MLPEDQKRILGYFIEEAKDHLNTIEQGLLSLAATVDDPEMMNEVFRAAHSVKGGAAMLGLNSIQRTSHRMEDFFKIMKESPVHPDRDLETMLLQIFDGLQEQLDQLQSPYGLTNEQAQGIMAPLEPIFAQAEAHLESLVVAAAAAPVPAPARPAVVAGATAAPHPETSALQLVFRSDVPALLRDMLSTFKQPDTGQSRQELARVCQRLHSLGEQFELNAWCTLAQVVNRAIANPDQTYRTLAPVVIKDLKQAQDQVLAGAAAQVTASATLQALLPAEIVVTEDTRFSDDMALDALLAEALNDDAAESDLADLFAAAETGDAEALTDDDNWLDSLSLDPDDNLTDTGLESVFGAMDAPLSPEPPPREIPANIGPEVGAAELNSLADLFEGDPAGLADIWDEADLDDVSLGALDLDGDETSPEDEFADLLTSEPEEGANPEPASSLDDDMAALFGYDLDAGMEPENGLTAAGIQLEAPTIKAPPGDDPEIVPPASAPPIADSFELDLEADLAGDPAPVAQQPSAASAVDDFFAVEGAPSQAASEAEGDADHFFETDVLGMDDLGPIDDDDAYTMPEFNLDLYSESAESDDGDVATDTFFADWAPGDDPAAAANETGPLSHGHSSLDTPEASVLGDGPEVTVVDTADEADPVGDDPFGADPFGEDPFGEDPFGSLTVETGDGAAAEEPATELDSALDGLGNSGANGANDALADLDNLLSPEGSDPAEDLSLDDLDSLLNSVPDEQTLSEGQTQGQNGAAGAATEAFLTDTVTTFEAESLDFDDFDDLDALLGSDESVQDDHEFSLDLSLGRTDATPLSTSNGDISDTNGTDEGGLDSVDDEFDDLEKLLEEADQLGGSAPSVAGRRGAAMPTTRRSPRRAAGGTDQTMRVSVGHLDTLSNLVGELVVNRNSLEQDQERLRQFLDNLLNQVSQLNDVGQRMRDLYERSLLESSLIANRQAFALGVSSDRGGSSHATGATFDALEMDRFTGFHTLSQEMIELIVRVREASSDIEFTIDSTDQIARQFRQVTTQLQEGLNKARMVPFGQTADRLPRAVRDISLKCGKEAQLVVEGRDTLIDKMILERLYDPMTHLVNNAITHGIETPEERLATGKSREGTITVRAFYQGNQTVIYIADNGGGINPAVVKAKALKKGLITPAEAQTMTEIEVYDLLFLPGFSTRDQADDFSGRGVGMDVVRTALTDIRGSITIESEVGKGTSFTIRLPLTLSITKALSCVNNQARIAFPMDGVEDMFDVPKERIQTDEQGHACILWRDTLLPFRPLGDLLSFNRSLGRGRVYGGPQDEEVVSIVVLRSASTFIALQIDQVIGEQEIVIKQLEGPVPKPIGIAGATVLGDGRVMPIADVLELIDLASGRLRRDSSTSLWTQPADEEPEEVVDHTEPTVLIVDDSITVRELLRMSFNKVGYRVEQARDGQEAWEKLRSGLPCDLVFCDIEMPRMDGLELLSRMQKDDALSQVPIAMLTSRGADRHRQMAVELGAKGYFTKPYLEEMLLDAAQRMLKGENMIPRKVE